MGFHPSKLPYGAGKLDEMFPVEHAEAVKGLGTELQNERRSDNAKEDSVQSRRRLPQSLISLPMRM
jgi:hypothetical protein